MKAAGGSLGGLMRNIATIAAAGALILAAVGPAQAHHSRSMFDSSKQVTLDGTVKEFQWTNPHCWIQVVAPGEGGAATEWSIEHGSLNALMRLGWRRDSLKVGDHVKVIINPLRSGNNGGALVKITLPNGKSLN
jgi:hypothetical protein